MNNSSFEPTDTHMQMEFPEPMELPKSVEQPQMVSKPAIKAAAQKSRKQTTSNTNLRRIESVVNVIFEDVEKIKNNSLYSENVPEVETILNALSKGNQSLKRSISAKREQDGDNQSVSRINKSMSKLITLIESIDISDEDIDHLMLAMSSVNKELSSHISMIRRKSEKSIKFSF